MLFKFYSLQIRYAIYVQCTYNCISVAEPKPEPGARIQAFFEQAEAGASKKTLKTAPRSRSRAFLGRARAGASKTL